MSQHQKKVIDVIAKAKGILQHDKSLSPSASETIGVLIGVIEELACVLGTNSRNSSKAPSQDPNRKKKQRQKSTRKKGGQLGRKGSHLKPVEHPDERVDIAIDPSKLTGDEIAMEPEKRQVFEVVVKLHVVQYEAQRMKTASGRIITAEFPQGVNAYVQYGASVKAHVAYLSGFQLIAYARINDYFTDILGISLSEGSISEFIQQADDNLESFERISRQKLRVSPLLHADETGVNLNGTNQWVHVVSNLEWTYLYWHRKRGKEGIDDGQVLGDFKGIVMHDCWKSYFGYDCEHALCGAHLLRELTHAEEQQNQRWAKAMKACLLAAKKMTEQHNDGILPRSAMAKIYRDYRTILKQAEQECPAPIPQKGKRGKTKRSKARNLLERMKMYQKEILCFIKNPTVPFTNNLAERDLRMIKVQQKISGCFRSEKGIRAFCRIRGYLSTCRKNNFSAYEAMKLVFNNQLPAFVWGGE